MYDLVAGSPSKKKTLSAIFIDILELFAFPQIEDIEIEEYNTIMSQQGGALSHFGLKTAWPLC
jgi:hypothetical protein